jgi:hypothetical protein
MVLVERDYPTGAETLYQDQVNAGCFLYKIEGCYADGAVSYLKMYFSGELCTASEWGTNSGDCTESTEDYDLYQ